MKRRVAAGVPHAEPLAELRVLTEEFEELAAEAVGKHRQTTCDSGAPLLIVAAGVDAYTAAAPDAPELMGDTELATAAERMGLSDFQLDGASTEQLRGALTALRGAVGEEYVVDRLTSGEIPVPAGTSTAELLAFNVPGTDLLFTNEDGSIVGRANVKIAATAAVISQHFDAHPDVPVIYASTDAAQDAARRGFELIPTDGDIPTGRQVVIDIGRSSTEFDLQIKSQLPDAGVSPVEAVDLLDHWPIFSMGVISVRALRRIQVGANRGDVLRGTGHDAATAISGKAAAAITSTLTNSEPTAAVVAMLTAMLTRAAIDVRTSWADMTRPLRHVANEAEEIVERHALPGHATPALTWWRRIGERVPHRSRPEQHA